MPGSDRVSNMAAMVRVGHSLATKGLQVGTGEGARHPLARAASELSAITSSMQCEHREHREHRGEGSPDEAVR